MKNLIICILMMLFTVNTYSQNIVKEGTTFTQLTSKTKAAATKTNYTFKAANGKIYPIYISARGKAFIIRVSNKTGKEYKQYLPEITKKLASR